MSPLIPNGPGMLEPQDNSPGLGALGANPLGNYLVGYPPPPPAPRSLNVLAVGVLAVPTTRQSALVNALMRARTKRKVYFAFRYQDIMRVNNVRKAWCIDHPDSSYCRSFRAYPVNADTPQM
jgi:hypothetical protein